MKNKIILLCNMLFVIMGNNVLGMVPADDPDAILAQNVLNQLAKWQAEQDEIQYQADLKAALAASLEQPMPAPHPAPVMPAPAPAPSPVAQGGAKIECPVCAGECVAGQMGTTACCKANLCHACFGNISPVGFYTPGTPATPAQYIVAQRCPYCRDYQEFPQGLAQFVQPVPMVQPAAPATSPAPASAPQVAASPPPPAINPYLFSQYINNSNRFVVLQNIFQHCDQLTQQDMNALMREIHRLWQATGGLGALDPDGNSSVMLAVRQGCLKGVLAIHSVDPRPRQSKIVINYNRQQFGALDAARDAAAGNYYRVSVSPSRVPPSLFKTMEIILLHWNKSMAEIEAILKSTH